MNRKRVIPIALAVMALALVLILLLRRNGGRELLAASGTVEATEAALGFQLPGRIAFVRAREGDRVAAGDTLAALDRAELDARRAQAEAHLAAARALLREMQTGARSEELAQARAAAQAAAQREADARRDLERVERLAAGGAVSQEALDKARLALEVAESQQEQAAQQLQLVSSGPRPERIAAQRAAVAQAEAALRAADAALRNALVVAPFNGTVTVRNREPGETVAAGVPVITLMNVDDRWVRIYIREDRIGAVRIGQGARIRSDTWPGRDYPGQVAFIASEAEFTPRNVQTTEERVKLVYAVKVRITADSTFALKPGMPADVVLADR